LCGAKPLDQTIVDTNANWLFHADYDQFNNSKIGNLMKQQMTLLGLDSCLTDFSAKYAFHPLKDVNSVTIFGQGEDKSKAVAFVYANFEKQVLLDLLEKDSTHEIIEYKGHTIHKFINKKRVDDQGEIVFVLLNADNIVLSTGLDAVKTSIDNINKKSVTDTQLLTLFKNNQPAIINAVGVNIAENLSQKNDSIILKQTDTLSIAIGEQNEKLYIDSNITAYDEQTAIDIENMIRGFISLGLLAHEKHPEWTKLAMATQLVRKDKTINIYFEAEPEFILLMSMDAWKQKMATKCMDLNP
jgi:hypothetical protein